MDGEDKRGWFVRFTIIRETILGVFLVFFLRNKLKAQARHILGQIVTRHQHGYQHKLTICSGL